MSIDTTSQQATRPETRDLTASRDLWVGLFAGGIVGVAIGCIVSVGVIEAIRNVEYNEFRERVCWEMGGDAILRDDMGFEDCVFVGEANDVASNDQ